MYRDVMMLIKISLIVFVSCKYSRKLFYLSIDPFSKIPMGGCILG
jgi:hypothetical protein